jgi:hypothetical protein
VFVQTLMRTRREFLATCFLSFPGLSLASAGALGSGERGGRYRALADISYSSLAGQVNTSFRVRLSSGRAVDLNLLRAPLAPNRPGPSSQGLRGDVGNERFSLIFNGAADRLLEPGIHPFEHRRLGRFEMYIGRVGPNDSARVLYEAVFNRPTLETTAFPKTT